MKMGDRMVDELISPMKAATLADCHNDTVRRAIEAGYLPAQRVGKTWALKREDVETWVKAGKPNHGRAMIQAIQAAGENPSTIAKPRKRRRKS